MTDAEIEQRYDWHRSQERWHAKAGGGKWHKSQARWHRKAIGRIPGLFTFIVGRTFRAHAHILAENITMNNALLIRLKG